MIARPSPLRAPGALTVLVAVAVVPIVIAPIRALASGWVPIGDNGLLLLRTQDVGTSDHPLLGTWTSASLSAGREINNPGPLWFDALAPFVRLLGSTVGFAIGVAVANVLAVVFAAWAARRAGGQGAAAVVTALSAGLAWAMGSELLFDAWQPHAMLLPTWALLVGAWALATGELCVAPFVVGLASLVVQTHLSFVFLIAIVGLAAIASAVPAWRRRSDRDGWQRPVVVAGVVAALAWLQPLIDQFAGEGNLGALAQASGGGEGELIGLRLGTRLIGSIVAIPPWWGRPGFSDTIVSTAVVDTGGGRSELAEGNVASLPTAIVGLLIVAALLAAVAFWSRRRGDRVVHSLLVVTIAALGACFAAMTLSPINSIGLSPHQVRWMWPVGVLVTAVPAVAVARWLAPPRIVAIVASVVVAGLTLANLPTYAAPEGPTADREYTDTVDALVGQLDEYDPGYPVVFDMDGIRFAEPYSGPVIAALGRHGVDIVFTDEGMVHQAGTGRRADGDETRRLVLREGGAVDDPPVGAVAVAAVDGLDTAGARQLDEVGAELLDVLSREGLRLGDEGRAARDAGRFDGPDVIVEPGDDPAPLDASGFLWTLFADGFVEVPAGADDLVARYVDLSRRDATFTVTLFEAPR